MQGKILVFGRNITKGKEGGKPKEWKSVMLEAYVHSQGKSFNFKADSYYLDLTGDLRKPIDKLRLVPPDEIPIAAGFCFGSGIEKSNELKSERDKRQRFQPLHASGNVNRPSHQCRRARSAVSSTKKP